jgi:hypothetical protein
MCPRDVSIKKKFKRRLSMTDLEKYASNGKTSPRIKVTKDSVRKLVGLKRLPRRFRMFVAGVWVYDLLKANGLHEHIHLWNQRYWVVCKSLTPKLAGITWRIDK